MPRTIAIVGAGPGVGFAVAERFGRERFRVALIARNATRLNALVEQLQAKHVEAAAFPADVRDRPALTRALQGAASRLGSIDVLEYQPTATPETLRTAKAMDVENEQYHLDLAVLGAITAVQAVLPGMLERKSGSLLFTTAASAQYPVPFTASFGVAAGAARNYARVLHQELAADGIYAGIVAIAGIVVQRGEETHPSFAGLPTLTPQDVADVHWRLHTERNMSEAFAGDLKVIQALSGH